MRITRSRRGHFFLPINLCQIVVSALFTYASFAAVPCAMSLSLPRLHAARSVAKQNGIVRNVGTGSVPLIVLIHGLDSSSSTWKSTSSSLLSTSVVRETIAMDCRGCGLSEMGKEEDFSLESLVEDVKRFCLKESDEKVVLLGHSMGARIALSFAATYPERVACLLMEDMDIAQRPTSSAPFQVNQNDEGALFDRLFATKDEAVAGLVASGYPIDRIEKWLEQGRIYQRDEEKDDNNRYWWSDVNPDFRRLCYEHVVDNELGDRDCQRVAANDGDSSFPIHAFVAGDTICSESSLERMQEVLGDRLTIHRFPEATHSIHSSQPEEYLATVTKILGEL